MALRELRVSNLAVIAEARMDVDAGFSALTGETGAGKSVCVAALRLALGGRVDADLVRIGTDGVRVAAVFDAVPQPTVERLTELGIPRDELLTLTRDLPANGRATCRLNGALVSQAVLREVGEALADVTAQGASQRLLQGAWQRDVLDASGGTELPAAHRGVAGAVRAWRASAAALESSRHAASTDAAELQRARDVIADLEPVRLHPGEDAGLQAERLRLRHAARIVACSVLLADVSAADEGGAADALARIGSEAADLGSVDPGLRLLADEAAELVARLRELATDARRHAASTSVDEARLAEVEERLDLLARVSRRFGSIDAAIAALQAARALVGAADVDGDALVRLATDVEMRRDAVAAAAVALSALRAGAARKLERAVTAELRSLELPHARFRVVLTRVADPDGVDTGDGTPVRCGAAGIDQVEFRLAANRDTVPVPLPDGPSGGELSRLALALSAVVVEEAAPALVLDEVDSGIGGETAARVGDVLAGIGRTRQVIAVTHRAEIAARAGTHLVVTKRDVTGGPVAAVTAVTDEARVREIARMMSGRATEAALARAAELLEEGRAGAVRTI